jgi:hypothetical protein
MSSSSDTTSIMDLPTDPANGGSIVGVGAGVSGAIPRNNNISLSANEKSQGGVGGLALDQTTINQIVSGLQQASSSGLTQLQSRDIPTSTESITHDPHIQPHYIPPPVSNRDYIEEQSSNEEIIHTYNKQAEYSSHVDQMYDELQIPLLIAVLFFLFQLPFFKKMLYQYFPVLFFKDGNINIYGYVFMSVLFGLLYYLIFKTMTRINTL